MALGLGHLWWCLGYLLKVSFILLGNFDIIGLSDLLKALHREAMCEELCNYRRKFTVSTFDGLDMIGDISTTKREMLRRQGGDG